MMKSFAPLARPRATTLAPFLLLAMIAACGGGGGGGGGGATAPPPADVAGLPASIGLVSSVAGDGVVRVAWDATDADGNAVAIGVFRSTNAATVFGGAPIATASGAGAQTVGSLPNGVDQFFGLAVARGGGAFDPSGVVLRARPRAPIHVDASSTAASPDGLSPATAFATVADGVAAALAGGGGNVWIAEGTYDGVAVSLTTGVQLYGGFAHDFALATRDPATHASVLRGAAPTPVVELTGQGAPITLDGLVLDGRSLSPFALYDDSTDAQLSSLVVRGATGHGLRLRSLNTIGAVDVDVVGSRVTGCGAEGVSLVGTFHLGLYGSRFASNLREGVSLGQLVAPNGHSASLVVQDCAFAGNGEDGLDCQLGAPPIVAGSSSYRVRVERSTFERNGWVGAVASDGLRIDVDFELVPGWSADVLLRGVTTRANKGDGILLDLDSTSTTFLHRVLATGNGKNGLHVTSETTTSIAVVTSSVFAGNLGAGVRAELGNVPVEAAHCVFAGNAQGGFASPTVTSTAAASIAWLQPTPFTGVRQDANLVVVDALTPVFVNAPVEYARATAFDGTHVTLAGAGSFANGDPVELADDGSPRTIVGFGAPTQIAVNPAPSSLDLPATFARFAIGSNVVEAYDPAPGSIALGAGMTPPVGGARDVGPFGAPAGGAPGVESATLAPLFRPSSSSPAPTTALGANTTILVSFQGGTLAAGSIANRVRVRDGAGNVLAATAAPSGAMLAVQAPAGGWPSGDVVVELHAGLASTAGTAIASPVAITFHRP